MTTTVRPRVQSRVSPGFEPALDGLVAVAAAHPDWSGQFCAYSGGRSVIDAWWGPDLGEDDLLGFFSATKGVSGVCIALLVERGLLDLDAPVSRYWPEFAQGDKGAVTVRVALSHQAGLVGVEPQLAMAEWLDHDLVAGRLAAQVPHWHPGAGHGYHALTIGTLADELVRRVDGRPLARFFREEIGEPRGIDVWVAVPTAQEPRVRDVQPPEATGDGTGMSAPRDSLSGLAFNAAAGDPLDPLPANVPAVRAAGVAAIGGAGTARGLARLYASCIGEVDGHAPLLSEGTIARVAQVQAVGTDLVLGIPTRFAVLFQKPDDRLRYGSHQSFGHDGAGGAIGVADPGHGLAYGYTTRRMTVPGGADPRGLQLAALVRDCLAAGAA